MAVAGTSLSAATSLNCRSDHRSRNDRANFAALPFDGGVLSADASGHRLVAYYADPTTPDHDAMVLLDMLSTSQASHADDHSAVKDGPDQPGLS